MRKVNLPDDIESPDDCFFTHQLVDELVRAAATKEKLNWQDLCGESINLRRQDLILKLKEVTDAIVKKGGKGYFWIIANPAFVETLTSDNKGFLPGVFEQMPFGYQYVMFEGVLNRSWRIYSDPLLPQNLVLFGAGFKKKTAGYYATLTIDNF